MRLYASSRSRTTWSSVAAGAADGAARTRPATTRAHALRMEPLYTRVRGRGRARDPRARLRRRALRRDPRILRVRLAHLSTAPSGYAAGATARSRRAVRAAPPARGERLGDAGADPRAARGASPASLARDWRPDAWLTDLGGAREPVAAELDRVREEWIGEDEAGWLASHGFYPGVIERLRGLAGAPVRVVVLTTKEGRFARMLLARQGLTLGAADVCGKEARRPKRTILLELIA